ncbi:hypothetical protein Tco_1193058 [Tanacetum coccineum]
MGCQKPGHLAARLGCAETKVATWDDLAFKLIILRWNVKHSTDIAKISRKRSKPDKHRHGKGKRIQEPGECYQRGNSNWQRGLVIRGLSKDMAQGNVIGNSRAKQGMPRGYGRSTRIKEILHKNMPKRSTKGHITDCHAGNPCAHQNNPRAKNRDLMIGKIQGQGFMGVSNKL